MKLYPYQEKVLECVESDPSHSQLISMPTGTGKTITFLSLAKKLDKRTLILVHREELLNQTYEKAKLCGFEEQDISLVKADSKKAMSKITIAMVPTLVRNLDKYQPDNIDIIIIDEAHHATAPSYRSILEFFKVFEEQKPLYGFTATPLRGDKSHLSNVFLSHSFKMTLSEATKEGFICPVYGLRVEIDKSLDKIDAVNGDYDISQLDSVMNCPEINKIIVDKCCQVRKAPGIIFCTSVNHAQILAKMLREKKKKAISISYLTPKKTLERIYKALYRGGIDFITNAVKLSEGFDYPPIQSIIMARPTRSPVLYKQMIGRGLRKSKGKDDCIVIEFTGTDEKMLKWEDIDENATFQIMESQKQISEIEALRHYKQTFGVSVKIIDIRESAFQFYECRIKRLIKYKQFYCMPGKDRFIVARIIDAPRQKKIEKYFNVVIWTNIWRQEMADYYIWDSSPLFYHFMGYEEKICLESLWKYINLNPFGKWYPSEQDIMTPRHRKILGNSVNCSARKAEFLIEDKFYKNLLERDWIMGENSDYKKVIKKYMAEPD